MKFHQLLFWIYAPWALSTSSVIKLHIFQLHTSSTTHDNVSDAQTKDYTIDKTTNGGFGCVKWHSEHYSSEFVSFIWAWGSQDRMLGIKRNFVTHVYEVVFVNFHILMLLIEKLNLSLWILPVLLS